jgi:hypothetical protein
MTKYSPEMLKKIVIGYVRFIDQRYRRNEIYDTSILPWPKETIFDCCLQRLKHEKNHLVRKNISDCLLSLAFYQDGVGNQPMVDCRLDLFPMDITTLDEDKLGRVKLAIAEHLPHLEGGRFLAMLRLVQADFRRFNDACEAIERQHAAAASTSDLLPAPGDIAT